MNLQSDIQKLRRKMIFHLKHYHAYKTVTHEQRTSQYAEDTDRYWFPIAWYDLIVGCLADWHKKQPNNAECVRALFALGNRKSPLTAVQASMQFHMSVSSVYRLKREFIDDLIVRAVREDLL